MSAEWEFCDYAWTWESDAAVACSKFTEGEARAHFWAACEDRVLVGLEDYAEDGWQPVHADLPRGLIIKPYRTLRMGGIGCIALVLLLFLAEGAALIFGHGLGTWCYMPSGYRIQLRRPARLP